MSPDAQKYFERYFPASEMKIIVEWEVPMSKIARLVQSGEDIQATINFPIEESQYLEFEQAFWLAYVKYRGEAELAIKPYENRAAYRVTLYKRRVSA